MSSVSVVDLLQSSGPIALNELVMRLSEGPQGTVAALRRLQSEGSVKITGPLESKFRAVKTDAKTKAKAADFESLTDEDIMHASDTVIEASWASLYRMFSRR